MPSNKKKETSSYQGPTPYLGKPRRDSKKWSYSENRLLDQITTEIMEAWKQDLSMMKEHYKTCQIMMNNMKMLAETSHDHIIKIRMEVTQLNIILSMINNREKRKELKIQKSWWHKLWNRNALKHLKI